MREHGLRADDDSTAMLSSGNYAEFNDFVGIMDVIRSGLLGEGRRLAKIGVSAQVMDRPAVVRTDESELSFSDIALRKVENDDSIE